MEYKEKEKKANDLMWKPQKTDPKHLDDIVTFNLSKKSVMMYKSLLTVYECTITNMNECIVVKSKIHNKQKQQLSFSGATVREGKIISHPPKINFPPPNDVTLSNAIDRKAMP